jgi:hypothetical protein
MDLRQLKAGSFVISLFQRGAVALRAKVGLGVKFADQLYASLNITSGARADQLLC